MHGERPTTAHRGAAENPPNRFEQIQLEPDPDWNPDDDVLPRTQFFKDHSQTVIARNDSPDVGFDASLNPYRGCEHGCIYCYARPTHEFLGFSAGLDFESKIMVKEDAPELLRRELASPKWRPQVIFLSGVTDCYQPVEQIKQMFEVARRKAGIQSDDPGLSTAAFRRAGGTQLGLALG